MFRLIKVNKNVNYAINLKFKQNMYLFMTTIYVIKNFLEIFSIIKTTILFLFHS